MVAIVTVAFLPSTVKFRRATGWFVMMTVAVVVIVIDILIRLCLAFKGEDEV